MEIKEGKLFTFNTLAKGQGFSFVVPGESPGKAAAELIEKLQIVIEELQKEACTLGKTLAN
jgi:hypothetical protein